MPRLKMGLSAEQKSFFSNAFSDFWPFIERFDFERDPLFHEMETTCQAYSIIGPWFGRLLNVLVRFGDVRSALEFGTGSGYSAIWIAKGLPAGGHLTTIERDTGCVHVARKHIVRSGVEERVTIVEGEAQEVVSTLTQTFDLIFVDCAHLVALESSQRLLRRGGLFICDNVGYRNKEVFNGMLTTCSYLETIYLQCYLKGRIPENTAMSISIRR